VNFIYILYIRYIKYLMNLKSKFLLIIKVGWVDYFIGKIYQFFNVSKKII
jgi:hypothetical protein